MTRPRGTFRLTPQVVAANAGANVVCIAESAIGQTFRLYAERPGAHLNAHPIIRSGGVVVDPNGEVEGDGDEDTEGALPITIVRIEGPIEQRAGYHGDCGGWSDGHDAIAERMIAALEESDVLLVIDSPGGAHAGLEQSIARVVREKAEHGRNVTVFADETIGSAAYWWAACVGDEIYAPPAGIVGSIGARAAHGSEAGALAQAGIEVTYFAWPNEGKIAFAPELPLSDLGRQRGERDVTIAGEAFAASVELYRGMTREEIVELSADALSGQMAVSAKLIDGVASFEDVLSYCVALAERAQNSDGDVMANANQNPQTRSGNTVRASVANPALAVRAEGDGDGDPNKDPDAPEDEAPKGKEPDGICKACGHQQEEDAKYCDQCGESMEATPLESEEEEPEPEAEGDKPEPGEPKPGAKKMEEEEPKPANTPPPPMKETRGASYASLLGLRKGASDLAIKTAIVRKLQVVDFVSQITGARSESEMLGQLQAMAGDAAQSGALRREVSQMRKSANAKERLALLTKLANLKLADYPRGNLLIDEVGENGRVLSIKPAPAYAEMKLATLRGLVQGKIANAAPVERSPFAPDPAKAEATHKAGALAAQTETAKTNPVVQKVAKTGIPVDVAAGIYAREFGGK